MKSFCKLTWKTANIAFPKSSKFVRGDGIVFANLEILEFNIYFNGRFSHIHVVLKRVHSKQRLILTRFLPAFHSMKKAARKICSARKKSSTGLLENGLNLYSGITLMWGSSACTKLEDYKKFSETIAAALNEIVWTSNTHVTYIPPKSCIPSRA